MRSGASFLVALLVWFAPAVARGGYDQYFVWKIDPPVDRINQCVSEMRQLIQARRDLLELTPPNPAFKGFDVVRFNGIGDHQEEDFVFPGNTLSFNFLSLYSKQPIPMNLIGFNPCKTNYEPYDEVVTACLLVARDYFPPQELSILSDGKWDNWKDGRALYEHVLNRMALNPLTEMPPPSTPFSPLGGSWPPHNSYLLVIALLAALGMAIAWVRRSRRVP
jgi:hypothetical protein